MQLNETPSTLSWSEMKSFLTCQRKHELGYRHNLQRKVTTKHRGRLFGTAVHAGIAAALGVYALDFDHSPSLEMVAFLGAREAVEEEIEGVVDTEVFDMAEDIVVQVQRLFRYLIPKLEIGTRYEPVAVPDFMKPYGLLDKDHLIEWEWEFLGYRGIIDAVLLDKETDEYILVDWKMRRSMPYTDLANVDGQLMFYATILNKMGLPVKKTIMWQFRQEPPKSARINKDGTPSRASQATTWDHWVATLPADQQDKINNDKKYFDKWHETLVEGGKLSQEIDFMHPVDNVVTEESIRLSWQNAQSVAVQITKAYEEGKPSPAVLGSFGCQFCDFLALCANPLKHGGDATELIEELFETRQTEFESDYED